MEETYLFGQKINFYYKPINHCSQASPGNLGQLEEILYGGGISDQTSSAGIMAIKVLSDGNNKVSKTLKTVFLRICFFSNTFFF